MLKPRRLQPGDRVAVVSPASPFVRHEFDAGVAELRRLGFEPVFDDSVFARDGYVSGSAAARARAFLAAWRDHSVAALVAVRGGYGSVQVLPLLSMEELRRTPKIFLGYSDTTSILAWLTTGCGITGLHGPMLEGRLAAGEGGYHRESLMRALTGSERSWELAPEALERIHAGEAAGPVYGGTLTQLAASLGTPFAFAPPEGSVLFLEDVNERPYRLDRLLTQLRLAGVLEKAHALVFGEMRGCDEPGGGLHARDVIERLTRDFPGPVVYGFSSGHTSGPCWTLPLGVRARVIADGRPRLVVEEPPVE